MKEYVAPTKPFDLQPHMVAAVHEIKHFTVLFVLKDKRVCSGIFVNSFDTNVFLQICGRLTRTAICA